MQFSIQLLNQPPNHTHTHPHLISLKTSKCPLAYPYNNIVHVRAIIREYNVENT